MRTIGVVTVGRSDYGIYRPLLRRIDRDPDLRLQLYVGGAHLSAEFGRTVESIERDGFPIVERVESLLSSDSPEAIAKSTGLGTVGFAQAFARTASDLILVLGDRFDMLAAALAALPFGIPLAHIHGGEATEGAIDDAIRPCLTKLSHLHFVATESYARRVIQLGEEPWRVHVTGAPALDNLMDVPTLSADDIEAQLGVPLRPAPLLVTFHPVTREYQYTGDQIRELLVALDSTGLPVVFTYPNADTSGRLIIDAINGYVRVHDEAYVVASLGTDIYFSLMRLALAMVGNSSSGLIEAASVGLPVVNIGTRQRGRIRGRNVIDAECTAASIEQAIARAADPAFRASLAGLENPYGDGTASPKIVEVLKSTVLGPALVTKTFHDLPVADRLSWA